MSAPSFPILKPPALSLPPVPFVLVLFSLFSCLPAKTKVLRRNTFLGKLCQHFHNTKPSQFLDSHQFDYGHRSHGPLLLPLAYIILAILFSVWFSVHCHSDCFTQCLTSVFDASNENTPALFPCYEPIFISLPTKDK